jgi:hypothetical protein
MDVDLHLDDEDDMMREGREPVGVEGEARVDSTLIDDWAKYHSTLRVSSFSPYAMGGGSLPLKKDRGSLDEEVMLNSRYHLSAQRPCPRCRLNRILTIE